MPVRITEKNGVVLEPINGKTTAECVKSGLKKLDGNRQL